MCAVFLCSPLALMALPRAAVFSMPADNPSIAALTIETHRRTVHALELLGRFEITGESVLSSAWEQSDKTTFYERCMHSAQLSDSSVVIMLSVYQTGANSFAEAVVRPVDSRFPGLRKNIRVRSGIMQNIPYLIEREIALLHENLPVHYTRIGSGMPFVIDAGTRSGIVPGNYTTSSGGVRVLEVSDTRAVIDRAIAPQGRIEVYPRVDAYLKETTDSINDGIARRYGPGYAYMNGEGFEKRYLQSIFVINPLGNLVLPGYASYLSVNYIGIEGPKPSYPTMAIGASVYLYQLLWMPVSSGFKENFFPFVKGDKTKAQQRYHTWLWATIPLNFTVCYFDHLALQYRNADLLPPFFENRDNVAALLSAVIPGGGHFYKGARITGWSYYGGEFALFGYGIHHYDSEMGKNALMAGAIVKAADIVHAYFARPSYGFFNREYYRSETTDFFTEVTPGGDNSLSMNTGVTLHF